MTKIIEHNGYVLVEVPDGANSFTEWKRELGYNLPGYAFTEWLEVAIESYEIIGLASSISEQQAAEIVDNTYLQLAFDRDVSCDKILEILLASYFLTLSTTLIIKKIK